MFIKLDDAISWVNNSHKYSKKESLDKIKDSLKMLNNPENSFKSIHVAGTNGKGSVSTYLSNILIDKGLKVGLYSSPYVDIFNERIKINNEYISDEDLLRLINYVYDFNLLFRETHEPLAFFEILTIISFLYFKEKEVDIAIIEVGLGGRLDATNVITPLVSVLTNISLDHTKQLGNNRVKILKEKLGIMKDNIPFITTENRYNLKNIIKEYAIKHNSLLKFVDNIKYIKVSNTGTSFRYNNKEYKTSLIGLHQAKNASLAIEVINTLNDIYNYSISISNINNGLRNSLWPGRFEVINDYIILDGAHNIGGIEALSKTINKYTNKNIITMFCAMKDKDVSKMINILDSISYKIYFTEIDYYRSSKAKDLYDLSNNKNKNILLDYIEKIKFYINNINNNEILLITGSLYFISEVRKYLKEEGYVRT